ncbi:10927_t:CDS:2 [Dentiscutata erythropus]|uniref:10927_t:CDS:1 n=1 Tax=Dentiscutata erythropus TaxID=1348616 RepID=A0A9N8VV59_9GLOM|nr:10927_t:CDS:2 [Dentiscutata erythropus]
MTENLKENNYIDLTQPTILNELDYERDDEKIFENFKSFNIHVNECINIIDEKQKDEAKDDSQFAENDGPSAEIKKRESYLKEEKSEKLSNRPFNDNDNDNDSDENEFDEGFFSKLSFGKFKDEDKDLKKTKRIVNNPLNVKTKRKKKASKVIPWTKAEECQLMQAIETHGTKWCLVREAMGSKRAPYCYQSHWNVMKKRCL